MADPGAAAQRQLESIAALERGELPLAARDRIDQLREPDAAWTSDLSVAELAAVRHAGFEPVGMVMGSSVYRIAAQWGYSTVFGVGCMTVGGRHPVSVPSRTAMATPAARAAWARPPWGYNWEHTTYEEGVVARATRRWRGSSRRRATSAPTVWSGVRLIRRHLEGVGNALEFTVIGTAIRRPAARTWTVPSCHTSTAWRSAS